MSYNYYARFAPSPLDIPVFLPALEQALRQNEIDFAGQCVLLKPHKGCPTFDRFLDDDIKGIGDLRPWLDTHWGIGFNCISRQLAARFPNSVNMEVDIQIYRDAAGQLALDYAEGSRAFTFRESDEGAARALMLLQKSLCRHLDLDYSLYTEEDDNAPCIPRLEDIRRQLTHPYRARDTSLLIRRSLVDDKTLARLIPGQVPQTLDEYLCICDIYKGNR